MLFGSEKIKENKTTFNNEEYLIKCKNESKYENKSNDKLELVLGEICVTNKIINITWLKYCINNDMFDEITYPCFLFRLQKKTLKKKQ